MPNGNGEKKELFESGRGQNGNHACKTGMCEMGISLFAHVRKGNCEKHEVLNKLYIIIFYLINAVLIFIRIIF